MKGTAAAVWRPRSAPRRDEELRAEPEIASSLRPRSFDATIEVAACNLLGCRREDGHWCFELETDSILESIYALLFHFLDRADDPRVARLCASLRARQLDSGGWTTHPGGPVDVSRSVLAYLCLKLAGDDPRSPAMAAAWRAITAAGGVGACHSWIKVYLAIFGVWPWRRLPAMVPEIMLLPRWFYFNLGEMSAWTRAMLVPLLVIWVHRPQVALDATLDELETDSAPARVRRTLVERFWAGTFVGISGLIKAVEAVGPFPLWRRRALAEAERWIVERIEGGDGLGGFFLAMVNAVIALRCLGYEESHPLVQSQLRELETLEIEEAGEFCLQPCLSPVWDTALAAGALLDVDADEREGQMQETLAWLLDQEVALVGDWRAKSLRDAPGGWCFEYRNGFFPDCDDTAEVLGVLARLRGRTGTLEAKRQEAQARGIDWLLGMQNPDGGWAAFDRCCDKELLTLIPFADHNAMIDPSTPDVSSGVVSALLASGLRPADEPLVRAAEYLLGQQEAEGPWPGRWGANRIYGTWRSLTALGDLALASAALGGGSEHIAGACRRGRRWLLRAQNEDGGWGESLRSYADASASGVGDSTASQTAWAMLGLVASVESLPGTAEVGSVRPALGRAVAFLKERQRKDGSWHDRWWTGVGFPKVLYLRYHGYAQYFPLRALAAYRRLTRGSNRAPTE